MIRIFFYIFFISVLSHSQQNGEIETKSFTEYLTSFDYQERNEMKIKLNELIELLKQDEVEIIDVRFKEEVESWTVGFTKSIPLNELPNRLGELDKDKLIITVCPHYDRAAIARHYLTMQGYKAKYLTDGLLGLADYLRGDNAKNLIDTLKIINRE